MPTPDSVRGALAPLCATVARLDLGDPAAAAAELDRVHPIATLGDLRALLLAARDEGWLAPKRATPTLTFGRISKPLPETHGLSIDVVDMAGDGAPHVHPNGEVSLCFSESGDPRFVGFPEGWVVVPPKSWHVPSVAGGRMLIVYFLPGGSIEFVSSPPS